MIKQRQPHRHQRFTINFKKTTANSLGSNLFSCRKSTQVDIRFLSTLIMLNRKV